MGYSWTYEVDDWVHQDQIYTFGYCACPNFVEEPMGKSVCPLEAITWDEIKKTLTHESQIERWDMCPNPPISLTLIAKEERGKGKGKGNAKGSTLIE